MGIKKASPTKFTSNWIYFIHPCCHKVRYVIFQVWHSGMNRR